jgi:hypothetical protein
MKKKQILNKFSEEEAEQMDKLLDEKTTQLKEQIKQSNLFEDKEDRDKIIGDFVDKFIRNVYYKKAMEDGVSVKNIVEMLKLEFENTEGDVGQADDVEIFYQNNPDIESKINEVIELAKQPESVGRKVITISKVSDELANVLKKMV